MSPASHFSPTLRMSPVSYFPGGGEPPEKAVALDRTHSDYLRNVDSLEVDREGGRTDFGASKVKELVASNLLVKLLRLCACLNGSCASPEYIRAATPAEEGPYYFIVIISTFFSQRR